MKSVFVLAHDYWHHIDSIEPMVRLVFGEGWAVTFTAKPEDFLSCSPDLFVSFKDPVENDQIPTPVWCGEEWTAKFLGDVKGGMGVVALHAALTDLPPEHKMLAEIVRAEFVSHPAPCKVSFAPIAEHPLFAGVGAFSFPADDEHYVMRFLEGAKTTLLAQTESANGVQPAVWLHECGGGKVCCITPAHAAENLTFAPFVRLVQNAAEWCVRKARS